MGTREDVDAWGSATKKTVESRHTALLAAELRVQVPGVHDAEDLVLTRRRRALEIVSVEAIRDRDDGLAAELRKRFANLLRRLGGADDDGSCGAQQPTHPAKFTSAMKAGRVDHHLVERPG